MLVKRQGWLSLFFLLGLLGLLAACSPRKAGPAPSPTAPPTPLPLVVYHTPAVRLRLGALRSCAAAVPGLALYMEELPASHLPEASDLENGMILRLGEGRGSLPFAASLGEELIRVVANPESPIDSLEKDTLHAIFTGEQTTRDETGGTQPLHPWVYSPGEELSDLLEEKILEGKQPAAAANLAATPQEMLAAVAENPEAIGWLPESWLDESVRAVELAPALQAELSLPILAITPAEPQGVLREFLSCVQEGSR